MSLLEECCIHKSPAAKYLIERSVAVVVKLSGVSGLVCSGFFDEVVDPHDVGWCGCGGSCAEPFGVERVVGLKGNVSFGVGLSPAAVVDFVR